MQLKKYLGMRVLLEWNLLQTCVKSIPSQEHAYTSHPKNIAPQITGNFAKAYIWKRECISR